MDTPSWRRKARLNAEACRRTMRAARRAPVVDLSEYRSARTLLMANLEFLGAESTLHDRRRGA